MHGPLRITFVEIPLFFPKTFTASFSKRPSNSEVRSCSQRDESTTVVGERMKQSGSLKFENSG